MGDNIFSRKLQEEKEKNAVVVEPIVEVVEEQVKPEPNSELIPEDVPEIKPEKKKLFSSLFGKKKVKEVTNSVEPVPTDVIQPEKKIQSLELFVNPFHDAKIVERKSEAQRYEKVNVIDLVNIHQDYNVILQTPPGKEVVGNNNMFIKPSAPKAVKGKNVRSESTRLNSSH